MAENKVRDPGAMSMDHFLVELFFIVDEFLEAFYMPAPAFTPAVSAVIVSENGISRRDKFIDDICITVYVFGIAMDDMHHGFGWGVGMP
jgi:hypothetical protein